LQILADAAQLFSDRQFRASPAVRQSIRG
jgi:hypothetical protein